MKTLSLRSQAENLKLRNRATLRQENLSELDSNRQNYLLNSIGELQTIITCTGLEEFVNNRFEINKVFKVSDGVIHE